jgi:O-antigen/teichoic acid export membrane protein
VLNLDRVLILWRVPDGARALGLYSIALMGTSWSLDLAGRLVLVMYTSFQTTLGRTGDRDVVARQASQATEAQATPLAAGSAIAYLVGPLFLGALMPRYAEGLPALRPLLPGMVLLGLAWPARQLMITVNRPYGLCLVTLGGLVVTAVAGVFGADHAKTAIVGVAWGMSLGYASVYVLTSAAAFVPSLGWRGWLDHQGRIVMTLAWFATGAVIACHVPLPGGSEGGGMVAWWTALAGRCGILAAWGLPALARWGRRYQWGGLFDRGTRRAAV